MIALSLYAKSWGEKQHSSRRNIELFICSDRQPKICRKIYSTSSKTHKMRNVRRTLNAKMSRICSNSFERTGRSWKDRRKSSSIHSSRTSWSFRSSSKRGNNSKPQPKAYRKNYRQWPQRRKSYSKNTTRRKAQFEGTTRTSPISRARSIKWEKWLLATQFQFTTWNRK
jgi:hypothetical protein